MSRRLVKKSGDPEHDQQALRSIAQLQDMIDQGRSFSGHERNCCFLNLPGGRFATVSAVTGLDFDDDGRAVAVCDWDGDGDADLWISNRNAPRLRFVRNETPRTGHYLSLLLEGNGKNTNRDAIGARVEVHSPKLGGRRIIRTVRAGEGFLSQSSRWLCIGLRDLDRVEVVVDWPGGGKERFTIPAVDRRYRLVQGTGVAREVPQRAAVDLRPRAQKAKPVTDTARIPLVTPLPMARYLAYVDFEGIEQGLPCGRGKPCVVILWASWCRPCREELEEIARRADLLRSHGIELVALAVDGVGDDPSSPEKAAAFCRQIDFPFPTGKANANLVKLLSGYHHMLIALKRPLPVPTSFLFDAQGRMTVIYKGRIALDKLLEDAELPDAPLQERWRRAAPLPGRMIGDEHLYASLRTMEANTLYEMAVQFVNMGRRYGEKDRFADAATYFQMVLERSPDFAAVHPQLALVYERLGRPESAIRHYIKAIEHYPRMAYLHYNLGNLLVQKQQFEQAIECYRKAVSLDADYKQAYTNMGAAYLALRKLDQAEMALQAALRIDPDFAPAQQAMAAVQKLKSRE